MNYYIGEAAGKVYEFLADQKNNEETISKISKELSVEQSFIQIGGLTGFVFLLLVISYIIIHRNTNRIKRYKRETTNLIKQL